MIKNKLSTIYTKLSLVLILSAILSLSIFSISRYYAFNFYQLSIKLNINKFDADSILDNLSKKAIKIMAEPKTKQEKKERKKFLRSADSYTAVIITQNNDSFDIIASYFPKITNSIDTFLGPISSLKLDFEQAINNFDDYNQDKSRLINFKDGLFRVYVYDYHIYTLISYYFYFTLFLASLAFILPSLFYIHHKIKYIKQLKNQVLDISNGNLDSPIIIKSNDEITVLAKEVDNLRLDLKQNITNENEVRKTNQELISSLSHDIRTPMTSLLGYLDILRLKKYQTQEQYDYYLKSCIDKVQQIKELSNKTFDYATVFEKIDINLTNLPISFINDYLKDNIEYLKLENFNVQTSIDDTNLAINGNITSIKRVINNLFSNLFKYSDNQKPITIISTIYQGNLKITISNFKKQNIDLIESNKIGLKSVENLIKAHNGEIFVQNLAEKFIILIKIPISNKYD